MDKIEDWIDRRLQEVTKSNSSVTDAVRKRIRSLFKSKIIERQLRPDELSDTANALITDMNAQEPEQETNDEN